MAIAWKTRRFTVADYHQVYRQPEPEGYRQTRILRRGESTVIEALPDLAIRLDDVLG